MVHTIAICGTCPRAGQPAVPRLAPALRDAFGAAPPLDYELETLHCLGACRLPCNLALRAPSKWRLRFSRLGPPHLAAVLTTAELYRRSRDGLIARAEMPVEMAERLSATSPESLVHAQHLSAALGRAETDDLWISNRGAKR